MTWRQRLREYGLLMRIDRPIGILLLLWPTLWALFIAARGMPDLLVLFVFSTGVFLMRSAGCVINDYADRDIDGHVERTRNRPLAQKRVSTKEAILLFVVLSLTAFALVLSMNTLTIMMSFVGAALAASYPFMKRFTHLPQIHLGAAFGWSVPMAYAAQAEAVPVEAWLLFLVTLLWTTAYDTMYAMVDREDDLKIGVKSTAILFGEADRVIIGALQFLVLLGLALIGYRIGAGIAFYCGLVVAAGFVIYQLILIKDRDRGLCFKAFLNNNWFGMAVFGGIFVNFLF
ncbi:MAG: 4-hydroxybenzoate octaprenyltransferase [Gammaproteobacteria bacterium]|nr:4-hydroxybenzoate octaprenyltransferase [Gammaproteobacteria bacterium]